MNYSGYGGYNSGGIYKDLLLDDGTRMIVSSTMNYNGRYISFCKFVCKDDSFFYALSFESSQEIPRNSSIVFFRRNGGVYRLIESSESDVSTVSEEKVSLDPYLLIGRGIHPFLFLSSKQTVSDRYYALYILSKDDLRFIKDGFDGARIQSLSGYHSFISGSFYARQFGQWIDRVKGFVDNRSGKSVGLMLEGF